MPTKYGIPSIAIWQQLGVDFSIFSIARAQQILEQTGIGFIYLPQHFPLAHQLVPYREQIGKRPTLATAELVWLPVKEKISVVAGFVHPPTEERLISTLKLRGIENYTIVKGLEGSCDLSCNRTAIIGMGNEQTGFTRFLLHPEEYGFNGSDVPLESIGQLKEILEAVVAGKNTDLSAAVILNGGFYLWRSGVCSTLEIGFTLAKEAIDSGAIHDKLKQLQDVTSSLD